MIMDLPKEFSIGNTWQKNDAFIENGILKIRKEASYRYIIYEITFKLKGGKHICRYCGKTFGNRKEEISKKLFISNHTTKAHVASIYKKLGVSNRVQAAIKSMKLGAENIFDLSDILG